MAIGRISGSMLKSNLTRNGVDLAFETNILYLDVTNSRVGIGTSSPSTALQVNGTTTTTGLVAGGITYPTTDGTANQILSTNGSGVLSFTSLNSFEGITFVGDDSSGSTINTAETLKFTGSNNITTTVVNDTVTITGSKDIDVNSISSGDSTAIQINDAVNMAGDLSMNGNKITNLPTPLSNSEPATKSYVDSQFAAAGSGTVTSITAGTGLTASPSNPITTTGTLSLDFTTVIARVVGDDSTGTDLRVGETVKIAGAGGITTAVSGDTLTITGANQAQGITVVGDDSTGTRISDGETLQIAGGNNITAAMSGDILTITGIKDININSISSTDSTSIQINDGVNISGATHLHGDLTVTGDLITLGRTTAPGEGSIGMSFTSILGGLELTNPNGNSGMAMGMSFAGSPGGEGQMIFEGNNASGYALVPSNNNQYTLGRPEVAGPGSAAYWKNLYVYNVNFPDGTEQTTAAKITVVGDDSTGTSFNNGETIKIAGAGGITTAVSGDVLTITGSKDIDINSISSTDSTAIQINDAVNIAGILSVGGNKISNVSDPVANQDAATKNYVDSQLSGVSTSFFVEDGTSTIATIDSGDTLRIIGSGGITTAVSGDTLTITGANQAQGITFFDDASTSTAIPDGGALQITSGEGISTSILGNVITITNTSTQLEIDGGSAYSVYNAISEALIDGGTA